jgi:RND family efflux transporter MFP subunit|tara:strand:- start:1344 stop:2378 length:1035 start_codon:yes stop_codon:yes gene_type:complete
MKNLLIFTLSILLSIGVLSSCKEHKNTKKNPLSISVKVIAVKSMLMNKVVEYSGNILPYKTIKQGFMVSGKVQSVFVENGDYIEQGKIIAALDPTDYQFAVDAALAQFDEAAKEYVRLKSMYDKGSLTQSDYDKVTADVEEAEANYGYKKRQLSETKLYAAHSGYVVDEGVQPGEVISQGMPLFGIVYTDTVYAEAAVPEQEINFFFENMIVELYAPALNEYYFGIIEQIEAVADKAARSFPVKAKVANVDNLLKPGMISFMNVELRELEGVISIPAEAVVTDANGHKYVFTVTNDTAINKQRVSCGIAMDSNVKILKGLDPGDIIVVEGQTKLYRGAKVKITN